MKRWLIILTAPLLAYICIFTELGHAFPFWVIRSAAHVADTLFHECGHAIFAWLFGMPSIPSIFTLFGTEQASGLAWMWPRMWIVQIAVYGGLGYACWLFYSAMSNWFWPILSLTIIVIIMSFTNKYLLLVDYMGHGTAILMGGFFLYRGWLNLDSRNLYERWLNSFLGFTLTLGNIEFSSKLIHDADFNERYSGSLIGGTTHHDFVKVAGQLQLQGAESVAWFTIIFTSSVIAISCGYSAYKYFTKES